MTQTNEAAFEIVIEAHLLTIGHEPVSRDGFDRERAIFPETLLAFIREIQAKEWAKLGGPPRKQDPRADPR
jgi:type I restriction enzyme R subunit